MSTNYDKIEWTLDEFEKKHPDWTRASPSRLVKDEISAELLGVQTLRDGLWHIRYEVSMYFDHGDTHTFIEGFGDTPEEALENLKKALKARVELIQKRLEVL